MATVKHAARHIEEQEEAPALAFQEQRHVPVLKRNASIQIGSAPPFTPRVYCSVPHQWCALHFARLIQTDSRSLRVDIEGA